ncbi:fibronectin type III domain-containing protein [Mesonia sp. K7]|uniref:fibronectin type III domain-containing protein n=1 Tax=Mesonia sp. K7 TaxID=2218606 RepID=UPI000DA700DD|nr:fibronectin type III domain-containing protein [Mesonia sp. K7]PZD79561.1 hypothetical protein DNG35_00715 [Mesonia sp. K7]
MRKITFLLAFLVLCYWQGTAQISSYYTFSEYSGTYTPITGGTVTTTITGSSDDGEELNVPIGFTIDYAGTGYSTLTIGVNGAISFTDDAVDYDNNLSATAADQIDVIAPLWDDLYHRGSPDNAEIRYETSGTSPNQTFTIQWTNLSWRNSGNNVSFQLVLYEGSNNIQFNYGPNTSTESRTASIGFNKGNSGSNFISVTPGAPGTASTTTATNNISSSNYPGDGTTYLFTYAAPSCITPVNVQNTSVAATTADFSWDAETTATDGYNWVVMADGDDPATDTPVTGGSTNPTTYVAQATGLTAQTDYDFYVQSDCGASGQSGWSLKVDFSTPCATYVATSSAPFVENFNTTSMPACWSQTSDWEFSGNIGWNTTGCSATPSDHTAGGGGSYAAVDMTDISATETIALELPLIDVSALTAPRLNFYMFMCTQGYAPPNELHVEAYDGAAWNQVGVVDTGSASWENYTFILLNHVVGNTVQLRFRAQEGPTGNTFYGDIAIDDIMVEEGPSCLKPTNIVNTSVTANTADFTWDAPAIAPTSGYEWLVMASGSPAPDTSTAVSTGTAATNNTTAGSLTQVTTYDFYVRSDCGGTDQSAWEGPLSFTTGCPSQLAGNYTIGATGDYTTITAAIADLNACGISAAVTFDIMTGSGPYNEQLTLNEVTGASATNTITFNGNGETLTSTTDASNRSLFLLDGADYVTLNNINFVTQDVDNNFVIQITNGANFNSITNNTIDLTSAINDTGSDNAGIVLSGSLTSATSDGDSGNVTITGNTIIGGYYGISISGSATASSMSNIISNNEIGDFYTYGIYLNDVSGSTIDENDIHRANRANVGSFYGLYTTGNCENNLVNANKIHDAFTGEPTATSLAYCIYNTSADATLGNHNTITNNIIYNINGASGTNYGIYNSGSDGYYYYHNTINLDEQSASSGTTYGFYQSTTASDIEFKNNMISVTRAGSGTKACVRFNTTGSTIISDYNVLHINTPGATTSAIGYYGTAAQATLTDWQTASSGDANSVDVDPIFAAPATGQLNPNNPAVDNIGTPIASVTTDINGNPRSATTPDIGAFEFTPANCAQPSGIMANNITGSSADITWTENNTPAATEWEIEYGPIGYTQGSAAAIATVADNDGTLGEPLTGLSGLTDYDVYVRTICSPTDSSAWTGPYTFTTACTAIPAPYSEDFSSNTLPTCWSQSQITGSGWDFDGISFNTLDCGTSPVDHTTGADNDQYAALDYSTPIDTGVILEMPIIDVNTLTVPQLKFYLFYCSQTALNELFVEAYDGTNWVQVGLINTGNGTVWDEHTFDLTTYVVGNNVQIRFRAESDGNSSTTYFGDMAIDDVSIMEAPTCINPSNVQNTAVTDTTADFSWDTEPNATVGYNWVVMADGDDPTVDTPVTSGSVPSGTTTVQATGLMAETDYDFYVQSDCGATDGLSIWSFVVDFATIPSCVAPTNLVVDFVSDTTIDFSWDAEPNATSGYNWVVMADGDDPTVDTPITSGSVPSGTTMAQATGLMGQTDYDVYVQADCGAIDGLSTWQGPASSTTLCAAYVVTPTTPFEEDFAASSTPTCWSETGDTSWEYSTSTPAYAASGLADHTPGGGTVYAVMDGSDNSDGETGVLTTQLLDISALSSPALTFNVFSDNTDDAAINILDVEFYDGANWNTVLNQTTLLGPNWVEFNFDLSTYTITGNVQVRFTVTGQANGGSTFYNDIVIDDVSVYEFSCAAPTGVTVSNITTNGADFNWSASADETGGYEYVVMLSGDDPNSDPSVTSGTVGAGVTTVSISTLSPGVAYDFYVRTVCALNGSWSTATAFTTALPPCALPTNVQNTAVTVSTADFSWTASADETNGYIWYVMVDGENPLVDMPVDNGTVATGVTNVQATGLTASTNYDFYIQTNCGQFNSVMSPKLDFMTDSYPCTAPSSVAANSVTATTAKFSWPTNGVETGGYTWVLMADGVAPDVATALFTGTTATGVTSVIISGLTPNTAYDFYVQTNCATDVSPWSMVVDITTLAPPCDAPIGLMTTTVTDTTADFGWTASPHEQNGYNWIVMADGDDPNMDTPVSSGVTATGVTTAQATGLVASTNYDFYVQTNCDTGNMSDWSAVLDFMTAMPPCDDPTALNVDTATGTSLAISWTASTTETDGYEWILMADGDDPATDTPVDTGSVATGTTMVTISGLTNFTDYDFYLQANCGGGSMSNWVMLDVSTVRADAENFRGFEYYPNPVRSDLVMKANHTISQIVVYNLLGQQVMKTSPNRMEAILDFSALQAGAYMVQVQVNDAVKTIRIIKE